MRIICFPEDVYIAHMMYILNLHTRTHDDCEIIYFTNIKSKVTIIIIYGYKIYRGAYDLFWRINKRRDSAEQLT